MMIEEVVSKYFPAHAKRDVPVAALLNCDLGKRRTNFEQAFATGCCCGDLVGGESRWPGGSFQLLS